MDKYQSINFKTLQENAAQLIGNEWMLLTAGNPQSFNTMTASWGGLGHLWHKDVAFIFVRPQRYTFEFAERENLFTLSFFEENFRKALQICGSKSGRDSNKVQEAGLTPIPTSSGSVSFAEARLILECRKLYADRLKPNAFLDKSIIEKEYPSADFHKMYVGEILACYLNK